MTTTSKSIQPSSKMASQLAIATLIALGLTALSNSPAMAQTNPSAATQAQALQPPVLVNGSKVTGKQVDDMVKLALASGAQDTAQLRQALLNDLIVKEAILQEAQKSHLTSQGDNELKVRLASQAAIVDLWFSQYFAAHPVTEEAIKAVYDQDVTIAKDPKNAHEYQLAQIIVASESQANELISKINSGASFETLAKEQSLDKATGAQGGLVGWALPSRLAPSIADVVLMMGKGKVTSKPIAVGSNWAIIKVEDTRPFKLPAYETLKPQIAQNLIAQTKQEAIGNLMKTVKISQGK